jgi:hypothetical protein
MCRAGGDPPLYSSRNHMVARVEHKCHECGRTILKGEPFQRDFVVWEPGHAGHFTTCSHCVVLQDWLGDNCEGWIFGEVVEEIEEHARDYKRPDLARVAVRARNGWRWLRPGKPFAGVPIPPQPRDIRVGDAH